MLDAEFSRDWGNCGQYIEDAASFDKVPLPALSTDYRLVIVEGILGSCVSNLSVYGEGVEHLRNVHHIDITTPMVDGLGSGVNNARQILAHVETLLKHDQRAIILLGYSKGAPDIQQFLLLAPPAVRNKIAGFISVAGMVGGSRLYDIFAENPDKFLRKLPTGPCGQDSGGFAELSRGTRQDFLRNHPDAIVSGYTYSLGAASSRENTSKILQPFWVYVSAFGREEDSQMTFPEQILPGSMFLGTAKADHWAVALPFEQDPKFRSAVNRNHFPRAPLLESLLRIVTSDLASPQRP